MSKMFCLSQVSIKSKDRVDSPDIQMSKIIPYFPSAGSYLIGSKPNKPG
jgi:hypothetical protein